jgi:hypothetical protein
MVQTKIWQMTISKLNFIHKKLWKLTRDFESGLLVPLRIFLREIIFKLTLRKTLMSMASMLRSMFSFSSSIVFELFSYTFLLNIPTGKSHMKTSPGNEAATNLYLLCFPL